MATKRLTLEVPFDQYEFLRHEAAQRETTISGLIRQLIEECRVRPTEAIGKRNPKDPFFQRCGSFDGPSDLAEHHDRYLYAADS
jgi:hypothetical protein